MTPRYLLLVTGLLLSITVYGQLPMRLDKHSAAKRQMEAQSQRELKVYRAEKKISPPPPPPPINEYWGNVFALIIGISKYQYPIGNNLQFADHDADSFCNFLLRQYGHKTSTDKIKKLTNKQASIGAVTYALGEWLDSIKPRMKKGDILYFYWAGHGLIDSSSQKYPTYNTRRVDVSNRELSASVYLADIKERLKYFSNSNDYKVYLIIDACRENLVSESSAAFPGDGDARITRGRNELCLYSSSSGEKSYESNCLTPGSGIFTYFLLMGLQGAADINKDKRVTFDELDTYLGKYVNSFARTFVTNIRDTPARQKPDIFTENKYNQDFAMTKLPDLVLQRYKYLSDSLDVVISKGPQSIVIPTASRSVLDSNEENIREHSVNSQAVIEQQPRYLSIQEDDTCGMFLLKSVLAKIDSGQLIYPEKQSAYDLYLHLKEMNCSTRLAKVIRPKLYIALFDKVYGFIDAYLAGELPSTTKSAFELAYNELIIARSLTPGDSFLYHSTQPKIDFLKARTLAGSNNPKDWKEGIDLLDSIISEKRQASYLYHTKGILFSNKSRYFTASKYFDTAMILAPDWIYARYSSALNAYKLQEYEKSIDSCMSIIAQRPDFSKAYSLVGASYEAVTLAGHKTDFNDAIRYYNDALEKDSSNTSAYLGLARIYSRIMDDRQGNLEKAKQYLLDAAEKYNNEDAYVALGNFYFNIGLDNNEVARQYFERGLAINPFNYNTLSSFADFYYYTGNTAAGRTLLDSALVHSGYDYNIHFKYCQYIFKTVSPDSADRVFDAIIASNREDPALFITYAKLYESKDSLEKAKKVLERGIAEIENSPSLNYALAELYFQHSSQLESTGSNNAEKYLKVAAALYPDNSLANYGLYQLYSAKQNDLAEFYLKKAEEQNRFIFATKNFTNNAIVLGDSAVQQKDYTVALQHYQLAWQTNQEDASLAAQLTRAYYLEGNVDKALFYKEKAVALDTTAAEATRISQLLPLIYFDRSAYQQSLTELTRNRSQMTVQDYLQEALTLYKLRKYNKARKLVNAVKQTNPNAIQQMINNTDVIYSEQFIKELKQFANWLN
jgi:tetratricopeptide (TPR) repeat protein